MPIIVDIDGIDGSGGETQKIKIRDYLKSKKMNPFVVSYPDYQGPFGGKIRDFLDHKTDLDAEQQFYLYSSDMMKDEYNIKGALDSGRIVIRESGPNRTCAYQVTAGYSLEKALQYQKQNQLIADLVIFMDITPEEGLRRKMKDNEAPDKFEEDNSFLGKVSSTYKEIINRGDLGKKYVTIDGTKSIDEIHKEIVRNIEDVLATQ